MKAQLYRNGRKKQILVHRLVARAFIPNPRGYYDVNHKNCRRDDNRASNLEWCTKLINNRHARDNGRLSIGEDRYNAKLTEKVVRAIRRSGERDCLLADRHGVSKSTIFAVKSRKTWRHVA